MHAWLPLDPATRSALRDGESRRSVASLFAATRSRYSAFRQPLRSITSAGAISHRGQSEIAKCLPVCSGGKAYRRTGGVEGVEL